MAAPMPRPRASHPRPLRGNVGPRRDSPPTRPRRPPASQVLRLGSPAAGPEPTIGPVSDSPMVSPRTLFLDVDSPRVMSKTRCKSNSWKWWPGTESNHRHADFQSNREPGSARASRRPGRFFRLADRTAPRDRAHAEPEARKAALMLLRPSALNGLRASRPNLFRTERRTGLRLLRVALTCGNGGTLAPRPNPKSRPRTPVLVSPARPPHARHDRTVARRSKRHHRDEAE